VTYGQTLCHWAFPYDPLHRDILLTFFLIDLALAWSKDADLKTRES
jgi:hypothetical protein